MGKALVPEKMSPMLLNQNAPSQSYAKVICQGIDTLGTCPEHMVKHDSVLLKAYLSHIYLCLTSLSLL